MTSAAVLFLTLFASNCLKVYLTLSEDENTELYLTVCLLESLAMGIAFYLAI